MSVAAKKMYLNYNTLKYRVNRIVEMTGLDFGDSQTIFQPSSFLYDPGHEESDDNQRRGGFLT